MHVVLQLVRLAQQPVARDQLPDIMDRQSIKLAQRVPNAHGDGELVWRITLEDREPAKTFAQDALTTALHLTSAIGLLISLASAVAAAIYLRDREASPQPAESACTAGA